MVDARARKQSVLGFGGAFTDAAGLNVARLPARLQADLLASYFHHARSPDNLWIGPLESEETEELRRCPVLAGAGAHGQLRLLHPRVLL